jgi:hypothetical protein
LVPHWVRNAARDSADIFARFVASPTTLDFAFSRVNLENDQSITTPIKSVMSFKQQRNYNTTL